MTTDEVLWIVRERGLEIILLPNGLPALRGPDLHYNASPALLRVLELPVHRNEIMRRLHAGRLYPEPPRAHSGNFYPEPPGATLGGGMA